MERPAILLMGPTASGKSALAMEIAARLPVEIVSVDSAQVYRGMDVGTAKPTLEERRGIPHHLFDVADPDEPFSVAEYQRLGREALEDGAPRRIGERPEYVVELIVKHLLYYRVMRSDSQVTP